jgi:hypothetical protein
MPQASGNEQSMVEESAERHGVSPDAVLTLLAALQAGGGRQAQFSHPELGGMGQWSLGGMIMIGDMFNSGLKARVDSLCRELSVWLSRTQERPAAPTQTQRQSQRESGGSFLADGRSPIWWPSDLGTPAASGSQNDFSYAYFPAARCLAINHQGQITLHDTGEHQITGVSQQQGGGQPVTFTSQRGVVRLADLPLLELRARAGEDRGPDTEPSLMQQEDRSAPVNAALVSGTPASFDGSADDIIATIERLAELHRRGILSEDEFTAKKAELLSRL